MSGIGWAYVGEITTCVGGETLGVVMLPQEPDQMNAARRGHAPSSMLGKRAPVALRSHMRDIGETLCHKPTRGSMR